jgi:hypothetical protein
MDDRTSTDLEPTHHAIGQSLDRAGAFPFFVKDSDSERPTKMGQPILAQSLVWSFRIE